MKNTFGTTTFELSKEDMKRLPQIPILRMLDEDELIGKFNISTDEILFDNDLADYDIRFARKYLAKNRENLLETWADYVNGWK